jgi:hypothetical protein
MRLQCDVEHAFFDVLEVLAVAAPDVQQHFSTLHLPLEVLPDLLDDLVMEVEAEAIIGLFNELALDLLRRVFGQNLAAFLGQVLGEQRVVFLHGVLVVALRVAVEVVRTSARGKLDLPKGQGESSRTIDQLAVDFIDFPPRDAMQPCVAS